jgi:two-component system, OmpR family, sensor histidine kinase TorS
MADEQSPGPAVRILVIDDNEMSRRLIEFPLKRDGHIIVQAESGHQALELLVTEEIDLIFLDLIMEDMDGRQVLDTLQADVRWSGIPVVIVTGIEDAEIAADYVQSGASEFLYKPATAAKLREVVGNLVKVKRGAGDIKQSTADASPNDSPVLDPKNIEQLRRDYDDTVTAEFISRFQELSIKQKAAASIASNNAELIELERSAHDLKGGARTLGLNRLAAACRIIETACHQGQTQDAQQATESLTEYYLEAKSALKDFARTRGLDD